MNTRLAPQRHSDAERNASGMGLNGLIVKVAVLRFCGEVA
jgi:hypothetical protein